MSLHSYVEAEATSGTSVMTAEVRDANGTDILYLRMGSNNNGLTREQWLQFVNEVARLLSSSRES